jgi:glycosyltransferase 2 family protein
MPARARILFALKAIVSVALLGWLVRAMVLRDGVETLGSRLGDLRWPFLGAAIGLHITAAIAGTLRWRALLVARGIALPFPVLLRSFLVGRFIGAFTPSTTGLDGYRAVDVARRTGETAASASVIVVEKLFGLVAMATVCAVLLPFGLAERLGPIAIVTALGMAAVAGLGLFVLSSAERAKAVTRVLPGPLRGRGEKIAAGLAGAGLGGRTVVTAMGLGIFTHLCLSATFAATGASLGVDVPVGELLGVGNAIVIAVLLPVSVGGVGVREGAAVALLAGAGVTTTDAVLVALLSYLTGQVPALAGGLWLLVPDRSAPKANDAAPAGPAPA